MSRRTDPSTAANDGAIRGDEPPGQRIFPVRTSPLTIRSHTSPGTSHHHRTRHGPPTDGAYVYPRPPRARGFRIQYRVKMPRPINSA